MEDNLRALTVELAELDGLSGSEGEVVKRLQQLLTPLVDQVHVDTIGNLYATREGTGGSPSLMLCAHSDEIGAMVKSVENSGFVRIEKVGGTHDALLLGRKVRVSGKYFGVIGVKPGHLQSEEDQRLVTKHSDMYVDVGADSATEVAEMGIRIGDPITWISRLDNFTTKPSRLCGKGIDDRYGCAVLVQLLQNIRGQELAGTLQAVITVQEEVGLKGAKVAAYRVIPDCAIALDTIPTGDPPDVSFTKELPVELGKGPVIPVLAGDRGRGYLMHPGMKRLLVETAEQESIPYQLALIARSNTDESSIYVERGGIPSGGLGIPRRYSHSPVETIDLSDGVNCVRLLQAIVNRMGQLDKYLAFLQS